jgi:predicted MFS family arabinose efflux permease
MSMAIIGDVFPEERRGSATGALMSAFALASVAGVPIGLELGLRFDWHAPFLALAILGLPILFLAAAVLPRLDGHLRNSSGGDALNRFVETFSLPNHLRAFGLTVTMMFGSFSVVPFLSPYLVSNVGLAEARLPIVYIVGGVLTLVGAPLIGRLADRFGKLRVYRTVAPLAAVMMIVLTNLPPVPAAVAVVCFGSMMLCNAGRMIPAMAMITSSVEPHRRGGFQGANSAIQHMASGVGAAVAGAILAKGANGELLHYPVVGLMGAAVTIASLWFAGRLRVADGQFVPPITTAEAIGAAEMAADADDPVLGIEAT